MVCPPNRAYFLWRVQGVCHTWDQACGVPSLWRRQMRIRADTFSSYGARLVPTLVGRQGEMGQKQREKLIEPLVVLYFCLFSLGAFTPWLRGATSPYTWCLGLAHFGCRWPHGEPRRFHARQKALGLSMPNSYYREVQKGSPTALRRWHCQYLVSQQYYGRQCADPAGKQCRPAGRR